MLIAKISNKTINMSAAHKISSFACELSIIQAKNTEFLPSGNFFVRYYLAAGNGQRIQLNTRDISSKSGCFWNESFMLECHADEDFLYSLMQESLVFELRSRITVPVLGGMSGSQLLGRAEVPWRSVFESPNMEMEKWFTLVSTTSCVNEDVKPPAIKISIKVRSPAMMETENNKRRQANVKQRIECECNDIGCSCSGYEIFALAAALEGL